METIANRAIGEMLQTIRSDARLTQSSVAQRLGKCQSFISKLETGERSLSLSEIFVYCDALGVDPHDLLNRMHRIIDSSPSTIRTDRSV